MRPISRALRRGLTFFTLLLILELTPSGWCEAQCVTAPTQTSDTDCVVSFADGTFASQFFEPVNAVICGAAVKLCDSSASAMVTIGLYHSSRQLASATVLGVPGEFARVTWPPAECAGRSFLVVTAADPGVRLAGDAGNPYPLPLLFDGLEQSADLAFEILSFDAHVDQEQREETTIFATGGVALMFQGFVPRRSVCRGAAVKLLQQSHEPQSAPVQLELWDGLPNQGGHRLRSASKTVEPGTWAIVEWERFGVVPGQTYYLGIGTVPFTHGFAGTDTDTYPDGVAHFPPGAQADPDRDFTFIVYGERCPVDQQTFGLPTITASADFRQWQTFIHSADGICGASFSTYGFIAPATISLWEGLPDAATLLATQQVLDTEYGWITAEWPEVAVTPGNLYSVSFEGATNVCTIPLDEDDPYPAGSHWWGTPPWENVGADLRVEILSSPDFDCLRGTVGQTGEVVLTVNGEFDLEAPTGVDADGPIDVRIVKPSGGGNGKFVAHANWGRPVSTSETVLPASIGVACFPFLLDAGATPAAVWNNIGKADRVGQSVYFDGNPIQDPARAPTSFLFLPNGHPNQLPPGTVLTIQAVIIDPDAQSPKGVSVTNAVRVLFE